MSYEMLFSPMNIGKMTVRNRCVMTPAELGIGELSGCANDMSMDYYEERAKGGVGLIITGVVRVDDVNPGSFKQLAMTHDYQIEPMKEMVRRIHSHGTRLCLQLHHAGRQGYGSCNHSLPLVIPLVKAVPSAEKVMFKAAPKLLEMEAKGIGFAVQVPSKTEPTGHGATRFHVMSNKEIKKLIREFVDAAERCKKAGVDAVELHGGHGYLIQQFLSPHTNKRTDEYGGSFENRFRFLEEIVVGIKKRCGKDYPLIVRLTVDEMYDRVGRAGTGYGLETGIKYAKRLEELGVDAIDVTSACYESYNYWLEPTSFTPGWRAYLAKAVKAEVNIPVIAANYIRSAEQAERQLEEGYQDFIGSARNYICDPYWVKKVKEGRENEIRRCIGCVNCIRSMVTEGAPSGNPAECSLNVALAHERKFNNLPKDGKGRTAVVAGAGPAGLTAAQLLADRGFKVTVFEKADKPGGQVITASQGIKAKLYWCIEDLMTNVQKAGVKVCLSTEATADGIAGLNPDVVVVATGGVPVRPRSIKGTDRDNVYLAPDVIMGEKTISSSKVVIAGSGITGLETAEIIGESDNKITFVEMADSVAPGAWFQIVDDAKERIPKDTVYKVSSKLLEINDKGVVIENTKTGNKETIPADYCVLSLGVRPVNGLVKELMEKGIKNVVAVGDAQKSGTIAHACHSACDAVMGIA